MTLEVPGAPKFTAGDRVLLFLRMDHPVAPIIGLQTRSFRISGGRGDAHVRTYDGRPVLGLDGQLRIQAGSSEDGPGLSLEQFVGLLREMMSHPNYRDRSR